ncbi:MAG: GNAT family N-acetyltransferase [Bacteroidota bacterium]|nr:GNAT family N-acetyltransferase [Bacteroidota bacterium]MDP4231920.1 GNAT family N-acetyltransferase [Bacteroidota bacterium]MDP4241373.1 GNAT family N-acetyltransferase [Bacteroidota bacterium]MDP4287296.1 GNAT family N-acetyltransferase [Bacteroidota bacterium]
MSKIDVREVVSKADRLRFVRMVWDIYGSDPNWVPPMEMDRMKLIDTAKNPFYQHTNIRFWTAERDGKIVGRIGASINDNYIKAQNEQAGFFGFYESINDPDVANALFEPAERYLRENGMKVAYGPANPSSNDEYGLLIEGFSRPPVLLLTYNPPYYASLFEQNGYAKDHDLYAWLLSQETARSDKLMRVASALRERNKITIRPMNPKRFNAELDLIKYIYNTAWENRGFFPMTDAEFDFLAKDLKPIYDPNLIFFAEVEGKPIGFALSLPDVNQAFHAGIRIPRGMLNLPIALWNLFTKKKAIDTVRIIVLGVLKEYRNRGVDALLYSATMEAAKRKGYKYGEASWVQESNTQMNRAAQMMNGEKYKTYRVYKKTL